MGSSRFQLPPNLSDADRQSLKTGFAGGLPDYLPWPSSIEIHENSLLVHKDYTDTGCLFVPWPVRSTEENGDWPLPDKARVLVSTTNLGERDAYVLPIELARGKVNLVRNQAADWQGMGLKLNEGTLSQIRELSRTFVRTVCHRSGPGEEPDVQQASEAISSAVHCGDALLKAYIEQVIENRQSHSPKFPVLLSCAIRKPITDPQQSENFKKCFNTVQIPFDWKAIETTASNYTWDATDRLFDWVKERNLAIIGGPLFDFSSPNFPEWLGKYHGDAQSLANIMLDFAEAAIERYKGRVDTWHLANGSNVPISLQLDEEDLIWLNCQLLDAVHSIHSTGNFGISLEQPTGEDFARGGRVYSPFNFIEVLLRNRVKLASLGLNITLGYVSIGSHFRDFLDLSRLFDLYSLVGFPILLHLKTPSHLGHDVVALRKCNPDVLALTSSWSPDYQSRWLDRMLHLCVSKLFVAAVCFDSWTDAEPHDLPFTGLLDKENQPKRSLEVLARFREKYVQ